MTQSRTERYTFDSNTLTYLLEANTGSPLLPVALSRKFEKINLRLQDSFYSERVSLSAQP